MCIWIPSRRVKNRWRGPHARWLIRIMGMDLRGESPNCLPAFSRGNLSCIYLRSFFLLTPALFRLGFVPSSRKLSRVRPRERRVLNLEPSTFCYITWEGLADNKLGVDAIFLFVYESAYGSVRGRRVTPRSGETNWNDRNLIAPIYFPLFV